MDYYIPYFKRFYGINTNNCSGYDFRPAPRQKKRAKIDALKISFFYL